jgi:hypothetical protein
MPKASSKKQFRAFQAAAHGKSTKIKGMSPAEAKERVAGVNYEHLPAQAKAAAKKKFGRR